jgi:hypothetical protein
MTKRRRNKCIKKALKLIEAKGDCSAFKDCWHCPCLRTSTLYKNNRPLLKKGVEIANCQQGGWEVPLTNFPQKKVEVAIEWLIVHDKKHYKEDLVEILI